MVRTTTAWESLARGDSSGVLHTALLLDHQTLRDAGKLQFPWLVFIFLPVKSAMIPGRVLLLTGAEAEPDAASMFWAWCPWSAFKASPSTLHRHGEKNVSAGKELKVHQLLNATSWRNFIGNQRPAPSYSS